MEVGVHVDLIDLIFVLIIVVHRHHLMEMFQMMMVNLI